MRVHAHTHKHTTFTRECIRGAVLKLLDINGSCAVLEYLPQFAAAPVIQTPATATFCFLAGQGLVAQLYSPQLILLSPWTFFCHVSVTSGIAAAFEAGN